MSDRIRAFVGVPAPAVKSLTVIVEELGRLGRAVRPVAPGDWHVTLKFLGDVSFADVAALTEVLRTAATPVGQARCTLQGLGVFPTRERPSVVWAGLQRAEVLSDLAARVEAACEPLGFPREDRPFHPHLTLARIKSRPPAELAVLLQKHEQTRFGDWDVTSVVLFQSLLERNGSKYLPLATIPLGANPLAS
jgi:2'-5' RNA ligase